MKTLFTLLLALAIHLAVAQISITRPIQNSVLQRNNANSANVGIAGQAFNNNTFYATIQYRIQKLSPQNGSYLSTPINWTNFNCAYGGLFNFTISLPGGWYQLDIQSNVTSTQIASIKFGVGEVFIIAGQSNAQGVSTNLYATSSYVGVVSDSNLENTGCMSAVLPRYPSMSQLATNNFIAPQGQNSWCYAVLGNQLVDNTGVPVAFFNAAQFSTGVRNWIESIQYLNTNSGSGYTYETYHNGPPSPAVCAAGFYGTGSPDGGKGHPYIALQKTMRFYGSLFGARSILWHQGENDAHDANASPPNTNGTEYINCLRTIINQARSDFGHSDLSWWICKVSRTDPTSETIYATNASILSAQGTVQTDSYNKAGPYTDRIGPRDASDHIHFTGTGLRDLGNNWYTSIGGATLTSATPAAPNAVLPVTLLGNASSGFSLQAGSGYSQYFWFDASSTIFNPNAPTAQTISNLTGGSTYQCYAKHSNGQWYISHKVRISTGGSPRIGVNNEAADYLSYSVSPNPAVDQTTIQFTLAAPAQVNLALVDASGKVVKQLVNGHHGEGSFSYPVDMTTFTPGLYVCNLIVDDLHLSRKIVKQAK